MLIITWIIYMDVMKNVDILKEKYRALRLEPSQISQTIFWQ
jgi:hypothetical protein